MTADYATIRSQLFAELDGDDLSTKEAHAKIEAIEKLNKAEAAQMRPEPPALKGAKGWFDRHSDSLIKGGFTIAGILTIVAAEIKGDVIFRSKAVKYI